MAKTASRTQLTLTLGPTVDINNAGDMYGSVTVAEYEDNKVKTHVLLHQIATSKTHIVVWFQVVAMVIVIPQIRLNHLS